MHEELDASPDAQGILDTCKPVAQPKLVRFMALHTAPCRATYITAFTAGQMHAAHHSTTTALAQYNDALADLINLMAQCRHAKATTGSCSTYV